MSTLHLVPLLQDGWEVRFEWETKRTDGEHGRDFYDRVIWNAEYKNHRYECCWEGFKTAAECVSNFINKATEITKKK